MNRTSRVDTPIFPRAARSAALSWHDGLWLAVIVAIGINLRPLLTSVSPLLATIRAATDLSFSGASLLTSLPVVAMGFGALGAGLLTRVVGEARGVALGLLAIAAACAARFAASSGAALLMTALLAGIGVAVIQALLPGVMKQRFHSRVPLAMGLFSASIMGGGGLGASVSPCVAKAFDSWRAGLAIWAIPAMLAGVCWLVLQRSMLADQRVASPAAAHARHTSHVAMWRKRRAWTLGLYFGLVNGGYTTLVAWLPAYYQQRGASVAHSGSLLAAMTVFQAASAMLLPLAAALFRDRRPWLVAGLSAQLTGVVGLLAWPDAAPLAWVAITGAGLGGTFSLTLVTSLDHADDHRVAGRLVAFVQGVGFIVAAISPIVAGRLRDLTGSFTAAWTMLAVCIAAMIALTFAFSPRSYARWLGAR
ncbi:cyanate transporter [Paraburkholderia phymatum]|uniref:Major facilitator superfamily MFS_1 n=1 Tax=Paraburkholderia phymatum (strain DSM 17167 / CIP 108236 / LMG 21445 / STM815) TaxID=391038 RepID=B2JLG4_PARP8|nr:cyanate transporter [Paraburkholderia phymatum]ACC72597.1 major facilitator superfamily MFS_1 [Paraburkholderia phymatum STM815]